MPKPTDVRVVASTLYFLPIATRMPLKFGPEVTTEVTCARVRLVVADSRGRTAEGWGETPLSVQWVWPGHLPYEERHAALKRLCLRLAEAWASFEVSGHPIEVGDAFQHRALPDLLAEANALRGADAEPMPWLAALVACSAFDLALHDAFGSLVGLPCYETYDARFMNADLASYLEPGRDSGVSFEGLYPADFLISARPDELPAWHLVGGKDPIDASELTGAEPDDGYPVLLRDWIEADGLACLKVKLRGDDPAWDFDRLARVGRIASEGGVEWLSADFNCTVTDPSYVIEILEKLEVEQPPTFDKLLYVEQPFPYDLEAHPIEVAGVSDRKPLFLDESAHDWRLIRLGRELGWTGVALKTCKTQTGALLAQAWARAHRMALMVQDLTNPMLAQVPHVLLAAHSGTIMGVETNAMQFYPEASRPEAAVHPGLYRRRRGRVRPVDRPGAGIRPPTGRDRSRVAPRRRQLRALRAPLSRDPGACLRATRVLYRWMPPERGDPTRTSTRSLMGSDPMEHSVRLERLPDGIHFPPELGDRIRYDAARARLSFRGFMCKADFDRLSRIHDDWGYRRSLEELFRLCLLEPETRPSNRLASVFSRLIAGLDRSRG